MLVTLSIELNVVSDNTCITTIMVTNTKCISLVNVIGMSRVYTVVIISNNF